MSKHLITKELSCLRSREIRNSVVERVTFWNACWLVFQRTIAQLKEEPMLNLFRISIRKTSYEYFHQLVSSNKHLRKRACLLTSNIFIQPIPNPQLHQVLAKHTSKVSLRLKDHQLNSSIQSRSLCSTTTQPHPNYNPVRTFGIPAFCTAFGILNAFFLFDFCISKRWGLLKEPIDWKETTKNGLVIPLCNHLFITLQKTCGNIGAISVIPGVFAGYLGQRQMNRWIADPR